jgi:DNA polymerase IV
MRRGVDKVWRYCDSTGVRGRTVTLKIKFADFQIITRSRSRVEPISEPLDVGIAQTRGSSGVGQQCRPARF